MSVDYWKTVRLMLQGMASRRAIMAGFFDDNACEGLRDELENCVRDKEVARVKYLYNKVEDLLQRADFYSKVKYEEKKSISDPTFEDRIDQNKLAKEDLERLRKCLTEYASYSGINLPPTLNVEDRRIGLIEKIIQFELTDRGPLFVETDDMSTQEIITAFKFITENSRSGAPKPRASLFISDWKKREVYFFIIELKRKFFPELSLKNIQEHKSIVFARGDAFNAAHCSSERSRINQKDPHISQLSIFLKSLR